MAILSDTKGLSPGSHSKVLVRCDVNASEKCRGNYEMLYKDTVRCRVNNEGKIVCLYCDTTNNNNIDNILTSIDSEAKAYLLGWIASNASTLQTGSITITMDKNDQCTLEMLRDIVCPEIVIASDVMSVTFESAQMTADVTRHLQLGAECASKNATAKLPQLTSTRLTLAFARGYFDAVGTVNFGANITPRVSIVSNSHSLLEAIGKSVDVPFVGPLVEDSTSIEWSGVNALDFLGKIYDGSTCHLARKFNQYMDLCVWNPATAQTQDAVERVDPTFVVMRTSKDAVIPSKSRASDSGYDLTIIKEVKPFGPLTMLYDTCIKVRPPEGFYMDVVPRSSLSKSGYMLANSVGVIDRAYVGSIMIALIKVDPAAPDIKLPFCGFQMIPRRINHFQVVEVTEDMFEDTGRGAGGFGSTEENALKKQRLEIKTPDNGKQ
ncbi:hypothetical protein SAMD00019534_042210 [Acytostelium subglobosum LB1]|uniref:hypothetical protein n=1 Tax=Acytostelium subglobosum LB1 TaxID=1410327 RepID=UPI0006449696|nr:hypothetical protein SAMD00019534_042210 [Acytostelium subglobosum LB1]GAM21046.1 hypothetical protein SAMD00019534_042210 [Acytostelium subglobosum LB1]|eukprot:XP_012756180.1 hypothetical protein SAMD00019534_042210 [Acytostelium subglobosum LB1]